MEIYRFSELVSQVGLITFQIFDNYIDAHIMRARLESEDILCFLFDENTIGLNPLFANMLGGIKLKIKPLDYEKAHAITVAINKGEFLEPKDVIKCPQCGSQDLISGFKRMKGFKGILSAVISFISFTYPLYYDTLYKCKVCGNEFKNTNHEE